MDILVFSIWGGGAAAQAPILPARQKPFQFITNKKGKTRSVSFWGHCCLSFSRKEMTKIFQLFPFYQAATTSSWATPKYQVELCF